jgi:hypothetical protein
MVARLYAINRLPPQADSAVAWVVEQVRIARLTQDEMRAGLNERLAALNLPPIAKSSFCRWFNAGLRDGFPDRRATAMSAVQQQSSAHCPHCGKPIAVSLRASD